MFSNLSASDEKTTLHYPIKDSELPFAEYIKQTEAIIKDRREDLGNDKAQKIIDANSPFEYYPLNAAKHDGKIKSGALLIHGLLDCPFTFREIGAHLQKNGVLSRAILLPGHGTRPSDLMHVTYHDWLQAVSYGIETLKKEVESVYLVGFSTGAALAIYHALQDSQIAGIILLSPAIKVRTPVDLMANWHHMTNYFSKDRHWVYHCEEIDYVKYKSITFNGVKQVTKLTQAIRKMNREKPLDTPVYMILSRADETISSPDAIDFFTSLPHPKNEMLLYTSSDHPYSDARIKTHQSIYPTLNIVDFSHPSLGFSADNPHYGQQGDYVFASLKDANYVYGAFNRIEINTFEIMAKYGLVKSPRRILTYNPDFANMADSIEKFIAGNLQHPK